MSASARKLTFETTSPRLKRVHLPAAELVPKRVRACCASTAAGRAARVSGHPAFMEGCGLSEQISLFVDGGHLRQNYAQTMMQWSGSPGDLMAEDVRVHFGAYKCFFYDCLNDIQDSAESDTDFEKRIRAEEAFFDRIQRA